MESQEILARLRQERVRVEHDLAVGSRRRARRRTGRALESLMRCLRRPDPELWAWVRILATLAGADRPEPSALQLPLWPNLELPDERASEPRMHPTLRGGRLHVGGMELITQDDGMLAALSLVGHLAPTELPILLEGETGTGKEVVARAIHIMSARSKRPWVAVNCAAIPAQLQESELFGHARGAYTGASLEKPGLFEAAHEGTLFLDEVGETDPLAQVKLLRVLETGEMRRLGEVRTRMVDVRIVAATNMDVDRAVEEGRFRKDLLFRLAAVRISLPPLRERRRDILPLAQHFIRKVSSRSPTLTPAARVALLTKDWPGNVRELKFVVERAVALWRRTDSAEITEEMLFMPGDKGRLGCGGSSHRESHQENGSSTSESLACGIAEIPKGHSLESFLSEIERHIISEALERAGGNRTLAARSLGDLSRTTLIGKMKRLGLFKPAQTATSY